MAEKAYVVVEGPIGVGKTTLCRRLATRWKAREVLEEVEENPFLHLFYRDRKAWAFQTQIFFMISRFSQQRKLSQPDLFSDRVVADYMFAKDRIFASVNLSADEFELYERLAAILNREIPSPDLVLYLQASPDILLERISSRGRPFERDMSRSYIKAISEAYNDFFFRDRAYPTLVVNTDRADFLEDERDFESLLEAVDGHGGGMESFVPRLEGG
jgi:deoxyadenosine/deoxycytidine kinase